MRADHDAVDARLILVHGLWMRGIALLPLARRLRARGFAVERFDHASITSDPERSIERLVRQIRRDPSRPVHLVGHSLGGLLALAARERLQPGWEGRVVCLGSPLQGSGAARRLARHPASAWMLGRAQSLLQSGHRGDLAGSQVGMIAGRRALGLGRWFGRLDGANDGSVSVAETRSPGLADHIVIDASHSGLLFSAEAAERVARFLRDGRFDD